MIYEAFVVPDEGPPSVREIKRALLTFDRVILVDPSDRDLIPPNTYMTAALGMPPFLGISVGPVRPMGKAPSYDDDVQRLTDECKAAIDQGLLAVEGTYEQEKTKGLTLGAVPVGGFPLDPRFVFWLYRSMAGNADFLIDALASSGLKLVQDASAVYDLALKGSGDGGINDVPALPLIPLGDLQDETRSAASEVARARIGAFIKYMGYCEAKNLVPIFRSEVYGPIAARLINNCREVLGHEDDDPLLRNTTRVLQLCHEEYLVEELLDPLSVQDVIRLRTPAWGKQAEAREHLFKSVRRVAMEAGTDEDFESSARGLLQEYRKEAESLKRERSNLRLRIKCDLGIAALTGGLVIPGMTSQVESPLASAAATLAAGGIWGLSKTKEYVPALRALRAKEREFERGAGLGLHNFYSRLGAKS